VLPVLHEPGPIDTSWFTTRTGIPVVKGETIVAAGSYDGQFPHVKVMSVMHLYMARAKHVPHDCEPLPRDLVNTNRKVPGRLVAPRIVVPLTGIGPGATAQTIDRPPGPDQWLDGATDVTVSNFAFSVPNLSIPQGASITWRFPDSIAHDVTLANGPVGFSSLFSRAGRTYTQRFDVPGTYRLFCSLHPVVMHEVVDVRAATPDAVAPPAVPPLPRAGVGRPAVPPDTIHW
jgi:plastocyanin